MVYAGIQVHEACTVDQNEEPFVEERGEYVLIQKVKCQLYHLIYYFINNSTGLVNTIGQPSLRQKVNGEDSRNIYCIVPVFYSCSFMYQIRFLFLCYSTPQTSKDRIHVFYIRTECGKLKAVKLFISPRAAWPHTWPANLFQFSAFLHRQVSCIYQFTWGKNDEQS